MVTITRRPYRCRHTLEILQVVPDHYNKANIAIK